MNDITCRAEGGEKFNLFQICSTYGGYELVLDGEYYE